MALSWLKPPPIVVVSGSHEFFRLREIRKACYAAGRKKFLVERVDGQDSVKITELVASSGSPLFPARLAIVDNPGKANLDLIKKHSAEKPPYNVLVLHHAGKVRSGSALHKFMGRLDKDVKITFEEPKFYEYEDAAIKFCVDEAKRKKKKMSKGIATAVVSLVGVDFGILYGEIDKLCTLLDAEGKIEIETGHVTDVLAPIHEMDPGRVVDAVGIRDPKLAVVRLEQLRKYSGSDPTMRVCALLGKAVSTWLQVASLYEQKVPNDQAADMISMHPYRFRQIVLPIAKRWGVKKLISLLKTLARIERSVKKGNSNPWVDLTISIRVACL